MELRKSLRLTAHPRVALVGAGGKTSVLFQLAREYNSPVVLTASTHLGVAQTRFADRHIILDEEDAQIASYPLHPSGITLLTGPVVGDRTTGLNDVILTRLGEFCRENSLPLFIEADGSRQRPLKAPASHEPPIPSFVDTVLVVAGMTGLGKQLSTDWVFNPEIFSALTGLELGNAITPEAVSNVLVHPDGGLKNIPTGARRVVILNQAGTPELRKVAQQMAATLLQRFAAVITGSLSVEAWQEGDRVYAVHERVAGVVLAAGGSIRYGSPKQLLPWRGKSLVWHAANTALQAGLSPVVVVLGSAKDEIRSAVAELPVDLVHNPDWDEGQGSSVRVGVRALPPEVGGAIFLLADQPQIPATLLQALVKKHTETLAQIAAPWVQGRRGNPVFFDRDLFPELSLLSGQSGGRKLFAIYEVTEVPWTDSSVLLDVDTPGDYARLMELE